MKCVICKEGLYRQGMATVVFTKGEAAVIIKGVPAQVCDQCGEYTLDSETTRSVLSMADEAFAKGTEVEIRRFAA
jgi:YgiT-type zinc finger domain-containing protein